MYEAMYGHDRESAHTLGCAIIERKEKTSTLRKESNGQGKRELWQMGKSAHTPRMRCKRKKKKNDG